MKRNSIQHPCILAVVAAFTVGCGAAGGEESEQEPIQEPVEVSEEALVCGYPECADIVTTNCDDGHWPGGVIYYKFDPSVAADKRAMIRQAMDDWESVTRGIIAFTSTASLSTSQFPVITIQYGGGNGAGHEGCVANPSGCVASMGESNVYHELGHCIGPNVHYWQRYDGRHYWRAQDTAFINCSALDPRCSTPAEDNFADFGPFDYR